MLTFQSAGESHGRGCFGILDGFPFGVRVDLDAINAQVGRRQLGYGRGGRMKIETDKVEFLSGVRKGRTMGSPILMAVWNRDSRIETAPELDCPRPGHADLAGHLKFDAPIRDILERASARETTARVAAGALCRLLLKEFHITIHSHVVALGPVHVPDDFHPTFDDLAKSDENPVRCLHKESATAMMAAIDKAKESGDTLGGISEIVAQGVPIGLGSHTQWHRKLDGRIAHAMMAIQAVKGVEIGPAFANARLPGSKVHDPILYKASKQPTATGGFSRPSNRAGGLEGGISNGQPIVIRLAKKPISTMMLHPLPSVNLQTGEPMPADVERSDCCALPACSVVAENVLAIVLAEALCEKFGGDSLQEMQLNYYAYREQISRARRERK
jgi:chorismate synthase